jgi:phosphatidylglycerophosphate synthase
MSRSSTSARRNPLSLSDAELRLVLKPRDAWWTVLVVDPLAVRLLPFLRRARLITPTLITIGSGVLGVGALVCFALRRPVLGAVLYELRFLLDCLDGKLARLLGTTSTFGARLDVLLDVSVTTAAYALVAAVTTSGLTAVITGLSLFEAWSRGQRENVRAGGPRPPVVLRHRLVVAPSTVDVETLTLFVFPLFAWHHERVAIIIACAMLGLIAVDHVRVVLTQR